jgi:hypothetical protein
MIRYNEKTIENMVKCLESIANFDRTKNKNEFYVFIQLPNFRPYLIDPEVTDSPNRSTNWIKAKIRRGNYREQVEEIMKSPEVQQWLEGYIQRCTPLGKKKLSEYTNYK